MSALRDELFSLVRIEPERFVDDLAIVVQIHSRCQAFLRYLEEFGLLAVTPGENLAREIETIVLEDDDLLTEETREELAYRIRTGAIRQLEIPASELDRASKVEILKWERTPIGNPWRACVVEEGDAVVGLLEDAFRAHDCVVILDPGIGSGKKRAREARETLMEICRDNGVRSLEVWSEDGLGCKEEGAALHDARRSIWNQITGFSWGDNRPEIRWHIKKHDGTFHDRFIGFSLNGPDSVVPQAVTLGSGVQSFVPSGSGVRLTAVSRIPKPAFERALRAIERTGRSRNWETFELDPS